MKRTIKRVLVAVLTVALVVGSFNISGLFAKADANVPGANWENISDYAYISLGNLTNNSHIRGSVYVAGNVTKNVNGIDDHTGNDWYGKITQSYVNGNLPNPNHSQDWRRNGTRWSENVARDSYAGDLTAYWMEIGMQYGTEVTDPSEIPTVTDSEREYGTREGEEDNYLGLDDVFYYAGSGRFDIKEQVGIIIAPNANVFITGGGFHATVVAKNIDVDGNSENHSWKWAEPTPEPTAVPTAEPTAVPTAEPTPEPTAVPTAEPTAVPTAEPTAVPTAEPTAEPTAVPTAEPTAVPTAEPTAVPTAEPTAEPTAVPTAEPTVVPTAEPTAVPTAEPTAVPTAEPTAVPTAEPTAVPTAVPTAEPTAVPTAEPTAVPTAEPTAVPTAEPTAEPTAVPTAEPTVAPTEAPTAEPTVAPTEAPTAEPTVAPTEEPSADPSADPTEEPSADPSAEPTATPEVTPTAEPTATPEPGATPTPVPSVDPSAEPSADPSADPTAEPTPAPTPIPVVPTEVPATITNTDDGSTTPTTVTVVDVTPGDNGAPNTYTVTVTTGDTTTDAFTVTGGEPTVVPGTDNLLITIEDEDVPLSDMITDSDSDIITSSETGETNAPVMIFGSGMTMLVIAGITYMYSKKREEI